MKRLIDLVKLDRLDHLIRHAATGTPEELAERIEMSRSSLFELITYLREDMGAPIIYISSRPSYMYSYTPKFHLGFEREQINAVEMENAHGGGGGNEEYEKKNNKVKIEIEIDNDDFILDDDIDFNELYH